jgi:hypothetical protein
MDGHPPQETSVPVRFVHDQVGNATKIGIPLLEMVNQAPRSCNHNLAAVPEIANLGVLLHCVIPEEKTE